jgi:hypothetical protein
MTHATALKHRVKKFGEKLVNESSGKWTVYQCELPPGKVWTANSCHCIKVEWLTGCPVEQRAEIIVEALERVSYGVQNCENPECCYCSESAAS